MAKKTKAAESYVLFDVAYQDGSLRSNRRVPAAILAGPDDPIKAAGAALAEQDREIALRSGSPPSPIKTVRRSGKK
jgi:predicted aconitase with swiveling domain